MTNTKIEKAKVSFISLLRTAKRAFILCFRLVPKLTVQLGIIMILLQFLPLIQNGVFGKIINEITELLIPISQGANVPITGVLLFIGMYIAATVMMSVLNELKDFAMKRWDLTADQRLDAYILRKRARFDIAHYEDPEFQNLMNRAFDQGRWPIYALALGQLNNIANLIGIIAASIVIYAISPTLLAVSLLSAMPSFVIQLKYGYNMWGLWSENSVRQRLYYALRGHIQDKRNIIQTKMLQAPKKILSITESIMTGFLKDQLSVDRKRLWLGIGSSVLMALGIGYGIYAIIGQVLAGNVQAGTLVFAVFSLEGLVNTINLFLRDIAEQYRRALTARDMFEVFDTKPHITENANPAEVDLRNPPLIEFRNVSFRYPSKTSDTPWIFKNLSFDIKPGEKVGLVGQNGAGKSTLIKLLMRVYDPTEGAILVNGIDLRDISIEQWTSALSVLLQQYSLHEFSIESAIGMGLPDQETDVALAAESARHSGADEFIKEYPKGYQQQVSREFEDGIEPSQGQLQKIALARALYRLKIGQVLILDEPTAAIDPLAELQIFEQMEKATKGKTLILITHRFNSVRNVDKIIVLDGHVLVEQGSHAELMKKRGVYASMFEGQARGFREGNGIVPAN